ncbi:FHA domain-containing protein [Pseudarthrobacter siccitolerans]
MTELSYQHGGRIGIVRSGMLVVVEEGTAESVITGIWQLLGTSPTVDDVFVKLTGAFSQPIPRMPSFAVVAFSSELHVILRGPLHLDTAPGPGACRISGNEVSRWSERVLPLQDFSLVTDDAGHGCTGQAWLPVQEAVVGFGAMRLQSARRPGAVIVPETGPEEPAQSQAFEDDPAEAEDESATKVAPPEPDVEVELMVPVAPALQQQKRADEAQVPGGESDESYDHLWFTDLARSVEAAAVREPDDGPGVEFAQRTPPTVVPPAFVTPPPAAHSGPAPQPPVPAAAPVTGLIDSVPWAREVAREAPDVSAAPSGEPADAEDEYEHTVIAATRSLGSTSNHSDAPARSAAGILVLGRLCGGGHANPPEQAECSSCGGPLLGEPLDVPRPSLGLVKVSTGETIELDRPLVIGRRPAVSRVQGIDMPKLITLDKAGREVSGSHVEVRLEGWHVIMRDLKSTNGTVLVRDGQNPRRLDQGEDTMLVSGDVVELGGAVSLAFEDLR